MAQGCVARYRARNPRATPLYRLFEAHFDEVRGQWEERFERRCGFWRGFVDEEVVHAQWVFVMPKMLRLYFLHHRALLGGLAQAAWETALELMCAVGAPHRDVPGTPREARHIVVVPARLEAAGASSAWSRTFRFPDERPR